MTSLFLQLENCCFAMNSTTHGACLFARLSQFLGWDRLFENMPPKPPVFFTVALTTILAAYFFGHLGQFFGCLSSSPVFISSLQCRHVPMASVPATRNV